jgi:kumamolisin
MLSRSAGHSPLVLEGSRVAHRYGAVRTASLRGDRVLQVTMVLRPRDPRAHELLTESAPGSWHPSMFTPRTNAEFALLYDPGDDAFALVDRFAARNGLRVLGRSRARHDAILEGPASAMEKAFSVTLQHFVFSGGRYHAHDEPIQVPKELHDSVDGVLGLDSVPLHSPRATAMVSAASVSPMELARHYRFPEQDATGRTLGLLEFGGGYDRADLELFAERLNLPLPRITDVGVVGGAGQHGRNAPPVRAELRSVAEVWQKATSFAQEAARTAFMNSLEVTMDVELAIALGGGADLAVYFAPQGADGWRRALYTILGAPYPGQSRARLPRPNVLSVSWGESEAMFGPMKLRLIHHALAAAEKRGLTIVCSSGDRGSSNSYEPVTMANANFPASSPAVIACGGTSVPHPGDRGAERAWKGRFFDVPVASGGGMSGFFPRPSHQAPLATPRSTGTWLGPGNSVRFRGRWLPDVAANAAFETGVGVVVGGRDLVGGGTSAATPLWAALLIRLEAGLRHSLVGLGAWLYHHAERDGCTDITRGDTAVGNGDIPSYRAVRGWDHCTGLGVPDGLALLAGLRDTAPPPAAAGRPRTRRTARRSGVRA